MTDHKVIWTSSYFGGGYAVEGTCATLGCKSIHYLGGVDENNWPKVRYKTHAEAFAVAFEANQESIEIEAGDE